MKARFILPLALLLLCTGAALAQTPDWMTPAEETICDSESGAAFGLCNAFCEAMDCDSANPQASATACSKVKDKYTNITGNASLPCEVCPPPPPGTSCPCVGFTNFDLLLSSAGVCVGDGNIAIKYSLPLGISADAASCRPIIFESAFCGYFEIGGPTPEFLAITPEEGSACMELILNSCNPS